MGLKQQKLKTKKSKGKSDVNELEDGDKKNEHTESEVDLVTLRQTKFSEKKLNLQVSISCNNRI